MNKHEWLNLAEYPFKQHSFTIDGMKMNYIDEGRGAPVVMVHGTPSWSFLYRDLVKELMDNYRCIVPDHLGFGLSEKKAGADYRPETQARRLEALIDSLGLDQITLVVHDFGGPIGLNYAIKHPEKISRLIISNTWMWSLANEPSVAWASRFFGSALGKWIYTKTNFSAGYLFKQGFNDKKKLDSAIFDHYKSPFQTPEDRYSTWIYARELLKSKDWYQQLWEERSKIAHIPTLLVWGMQDKFFSPKVLEQWETVFSDAQIVRLKDGGHFIQEENGEDYVGAVEDFLQKYDVVVG